MVAEVAGILGIITMPYPHLILPYLAYYGTMATERRTMGVLGAPLYPGGAIGSTYMYLHCLCIKIGRFNSS
jgi:hypothetical protein